MNISESQTPRLIEDTVDDQARLSSAEIGNSVIPIIEKESTREVLANAWNYIWTKKPLSFNLPKEEIITESFKKVPIFTRRNYRNPDQTREQAIFLEKRRREHLHQSLNYYFSGVTYFDFFSLPTFRLAKSAKNLARAANRQEVAPECLLFAFLNSKVSKKLEMTKILRKSGFSQKKVRTLYQKARKNIGSKQTEGFNDYYQALQKPEPIKTWHDSYVFKFLAFILEPADWFPEMEMSKMHAIGFYDFKSHDFKAQAKNIQLNFMLRFKDKNRLELIRDPALKFLTNRLGYQTNIENMPFDPQALEEPNGYRQAFQFQLKSTKLFGFFRSLFLDIEEDTTPSSICFSSDSHSLFVRLAENSLIRFKTPVMTPEMLFVTMMEQRKTTLVGSIILKIIDDETDWYLLRYKLMKRIYAQELSIRTELEDEQQYFAYLLKINLPESEFKKSTESTLIDLAADLYRSELFTRILSINLFKVMNNDIRKSNRILNKRRYITIKKKKRVLGTDFVPLALEEKLGKGTDLAKLAPKEKLTNIPELAELALQGNFENVTDLAAFALGGNFDDGIALADLALQGNFENVTDLTLLSREGKLGKPVS
jgi:hypothetical protein